MQQIVLTVRPKHRKLLLGVLSYLYAYYNNPIQNGSKLPYLYRKV